MEVREMIDAFFDVPVWFWAWLVVTAVPLQFAFRALGVDGRGVFPASWVWGLLRSLILGLGVVSAINSGSSPATVGFLALSLLLLLVVFEGLATKRAEYPPKEARLFSVRGLLVILFGALLFVTPVWGSQKIEELRVAELLNWSEYRGGQREVLLIDPKFTPVEEQGKIAQWVIFDRGRRYELYSGVEGLAARDEFAALSKNRARRAVLRVAVVGRARNDSPQLPDYLRSQEIKVVRVEPTPWWIEP